MPRKKKQRLRHKIIHKIIFHYFSLNSSDSKGFLRVTTTSTQPPVEVDFEIYVPIDYGICENWTQSVEAKTGECSWTTWWNGATLQCFGGLSNLLSLPTGKMDETNELVICGWPNSTFDPVILKHFPNIKILRIEHSNLTHIHNDFPELDYLQVRVKKKM